MIKLNFLTPQYLYCRASYCFLNGENVGKRVHFHKVNDGILPHFCYTPYLYYMTSFQFVALFPSYSHFSKVVLLYLFWLLFDLESFFLLFWPHMNILKRHFYTLWLNIGGSLISAKVWIWRSISNVKNHRNFSEMIFI